MKIYSGFERWLKQDMTSCNKNKQKQFRKSFLTLSNKVVIII